MMMMIIQWTTSFEVCWKFKNEKENWSELFSKWWPFFSPSKWREKKCHYPVGCVQTDNHIATSNKKIFEKKTLNFVKSNTTNDNDIFVVVGGVLHKTLNQNLFMKNNVFLFCFSFGPISQYWKIEKSFQQTNNKKNHITSKMIDRKLLIST